MWFLIDRGLLSCESVMEGDFVAFDAVSRNHNIKVHRADGPGLFIKQPASADPQNARTVMREAACYDLARSDEQFEGLRRLLPTRRLYDARRPILVIELVAGGESVWDYHRRERAFSPAIGGLLGKALGGYHGAFEGPRGVQALDRESWFERRPPWILFLKELDAGVLPQASRAHARIGEVIRGYPAFGAAIEAAREKWVRDTLIHGDMKWENCLLHREQPNGPLSLKVIDWEMADVGDACWDVGAMIQAYLSFWVVSLDLQAGKPVTDAAAAAPLRGETMRPALREFWAEYRRARALSAEAGTPLIEKCVTYAAARMVQTVFEWVQSLPDLTPHALCQLQLSMNMLQNPKAAAADLFGPQGSSPVERA